MSWSAAGRQKASGNAGPECSFPSGRPHLAWHVNVAPGSVRQQSGRATPWHAPEAVHLMLKRLKPARQSPLVILIRGVEAIEYEQGMVAKAFESR
jgi:hypothetical protein